MGHGSKKTSKASAAPHHVDIVLTDVVSPPAFRWEDVASVGSTSATSLNRTIEALRRLRLALDLTQFQFEQVPDFSKVRAEPTPEPSRTDEAEEQAASTRG